MRNLRSLLERVSKALNKDTFIIETIVSIINKNTKAVLPKTSISLREGVLEITASPIVKNEIIFKEKLILDELRSNYNIFITKVLYK